MQPLKLFNSGAEARNPPDLLPILLLLMSSTCAGACPPSGSTHLGLGTLHFQLGPDKVNNFSRAFEECQALGMELASVADTMSFLLAAQFADEVANDDVWVDAM